MPQPRASWRSAPLKFERNFTMLALSSRHLCQTRPKRAYECEILASIDMPSLESNDALCRRTVPFLAFATFRATMVFEIFQLFACVTSHYSRIGSRGGFLKEKGLRAPFVHTRTTHVAKFDNTSFRFAVRMSPEKTILLTGGAGFIASHVARLFAKKYPQYKVGKQRNNKVGRFD